MKTAPAGNNCTCTPIPPKPNASPRLIFSQTQAVWSYLPISLDRKVQLRRPSCGNKTFAFTEKRKEPLENASHVRNAIARFNQVKGVIDEERKKVFEKIKKAAKKFGVEVNEKDRRELADRK